MICIAEFDVHPGVGKCLNIVKVSIEESWKLTKLCSLRPHLSAQQLVSRWMFLLHLIPIPCDAMRITSINKHTCGYLWPATLQHIFSWLSSLPVTSAYHIIMKSHSNPLVLPSLKTWVRAFTIWIVTGFTSKGSKVLLHLCYRSTLGYQLFARRIYHKSKSHASYPIHNHFANHDML